MKEFNIVTTGTGGQGVLTLAITIAQSAMAQGYDVKTSELHGLAQRYGTIPCHIRFGEKIYSPLVLKGEAHLIIALEPLEALRACYYGSKEHKTVFLMDTRKIVPLSVSVLNERYPSIKEIQKNLKYFSKKVISLDASEIVKKEVGNVRPANIFMLGYAFSKKLIPIKKRFLLEGIKKVVPEKYLDMNEKVFKLGMKGG